MNKTFTYSILQYKHSLLLKEAVNVGIIFYFPSTDKFQFVAGNYYRVKSIYPDFDPVIYNRIIKRIKQRLTPRFDIFEQHNNANKSFKEYINTNILSEDATALQFTDPIISVDTFNDIDHTVKKFSELLLPGVITQNHIEHKRNEQFLLKTYIGYIIEKDKQAENKISKNRLINYRGLVLNFDYSWKIREKKIKNKTTNLVRPVSFDLKETSEIQKKSVEYFGYLEILQPYAERNDIRFDLLVAQPQDENLLDKYEEGIRRIKRAKSAKRIITERDLHSYSEETAHNLVELDD
jgi:hypothetical protein